MSKLIIHDHNKDGIDRRGLLQCMAWAGTGIIWSVGSGVLTSQAFGKSMKAMKGELHFVQISDSHMGFNKPANPDVVATLQAAIDKINALPQEPDFIIHTGDLSHMSKPGEYDTLDQALKAAKPKQVFFVPGEHDTRPLLCAVQCGRARRPWQARARNSSNRSKRISTPNLPYDCS